MDIAIGALGTLTGQDTNALNVLKEPFTIPSQETVSMNVADLSLSPCGQDLDLSRLSKTPVLISVP